MALAFVLFKLEFSYPVPNYEFLKLDFGESFLLLSSWMFNLQDSLLGLAVWTALAYVSGSNPVGMIFKVASILLTLVPYYYLRRSRIKWLAVPLIRTAGMIVLNWYLVPVLWHLPKEMMGTYIVVGVIPVNLIQAYMNIFAAELLLKYLRGHIKDIAA